MKRAAAVAIAAMISLAGCSATGTTPASSRVPTSASAPAKPSTPKPTTQQAAALYSKLSSVNPKFDQDRVTDKARYVCRYILDGAAAATITKAAKTHFGSSAVTVTDAQAATIIETVKTNGFCK